MADQEGMIKFLKEISPTLQPVSVLKPAFLPSPPRIVKPSNGNGDDLDWSDDLVGGKWNKIRSAVMNSKSVEEVTADVQDMSVREWLDWVVRMAPKQVEVQSMNITAVRIELPPRDGFGDGDVIEVEVPPQ